MAQQKYFPVNEGGVRTTSGETRQHEIGIAKSLVRFRELLKIKEPKGEKNSNNAHWELDLGQTNPDSSAGLVSPIKTRGVMPHVLVLGANAYAMQHRDYKLPWESAKMHVEKGSNSALGNYTRACVSYCTVRGETEVPTITKDGLNYGVGDTYSFLITYGGDGRTVVELRQESGDYSAYLGNGGDDLKERIKYALPSRFQAVVDSKGVQVETSLEVNDYREDPKRSLDTFLEQFVDVVEKA